MTSEDKLRYGIATAVGAAGALVIGYIWDGLGGLINGLMSVKNSIKRTIPLNT